MSFYSLIVVAHDELGKIAKDPDFGKKLERAVLTFSTSGGDGQFPVHHSASVAKVISSFNANVSPRVIVTEGWHCYDMDKQELPDFLKKYLRKKVGSL